MDRWGYATNGCGRRQADSPARLPVKIDIAISRAPHAIKPQVHTLDWPGATCSQRSIVIVHDLRACGSCLTASRTQRTAGAADRRVWNAVGAYRAFFETRATNSSNLESRSFRMGDGFDFR